MKPTPCVVILNTRWGYIMTPHTCGSIAEAERYAKDFGMAYRIFDLHGNLIKSGWKA